MIGKWLKEDFCFPFSNRIVCGDGSCYWNSINLFYLRTFFCRLSSCFIIYNNDSLIKERKQFLFARHFCKHPQRNHVTAQTSDVDRKALNLFNIDVDVE